MSILKAREDEIQNMYADAQSHLDSASKLEKEYNEKINSARGEAEEIVKNAVKTAKTSSEEIISDAKEKADAIFERANEKIESGIGSCIMGCRNCKDRRKRNCCRKIQR